jgi:sulfite exporter TauE/SafE
MYYTAVVLGLMGSLHCLGMCGPLALALPVNRLGGHKTDWRFWGGHLLYNAGRIGTYAALGAVLGGLGWAIAATGWQQALSVTTGVVLLIILAYQTSAPLQWAPLQQLSMWVQRAFGRLLGAQPGAGVYLALGMANGLLPCGLVYVALTISLWAGTAPGGALYMALFGLGTLPMMLLAGSISRLMRPAYAHGLLRVVGFAVALLLIARGLNLGIPYISPQTPTVAGAQCH